MSIENTLKIMGTDLPNYDSETGIFYGVISKNSISPYILEDIEFGSDTIDLSYEEGLKELNKNIDNHLGCLTDVYNLSVEIIGPHNPKHGPSEKCNLETVKDVLNHFRNKRYEEIRNIFEEEFNNSYECDDMDFLYQSDGYKIINCLTTDIMIIKSPYYCYAPECSPCCPCAGNLDSINLERKYEKKTYCLDPDFFDEEENSFGTFPGYKIYKVIDDSEVI
jgi:hypothetical protein